MAEILSRPEVVVLEGSEVKTLLKNDTTLEYLRPFFLSPTSLQEASKGFNVPMSSFHYWIIKFTKLGLLTVAFNKKRSGSNIKFYITSAKRIIIKLEKDPHELSEYFLVHSGDDSVYMLYCQSIIDFVQEIDKDLGVMLNVEESGEFYVRLLALEGGGDYSLIENEILSPYSPASYATWREMQLRFQDAKEFRKRLADLVNEFEEKILPGQKSYRIRIVMAPDKYFESSRVELLSRNIGQPA